MYNSMSTYVKSLSKRTEGEGKEKVIPIAYLGTTMSRHGEAFEDGNRFGDALLGMHCLNGRYSQYRLTIHLGMGQVNERIARMQETYGAAATATWLEALERSMAQMKDYQVWL